MRCLPTRLRLARPLLVAALGVLVAGSTTLSALGSQTAIQWPNGQELGHSEPYCGPNASAWIFGVGNTGAGGQVSPNAHGRLILHSNPPQYLAPDGGAACTLFNPPGFVSTTNLHSFYSLGHHCQDPPISGVPCTGAPASAGTTAYPDFAHMVRAFNATTINGVNVGYDYAWYWLFIRGTWCPTGTGGGACHYRAGHWQPLRVTYHGPRAPYQASDLAVEKGTGSVGKPPTGQTCGTAPSYCPPVANATWTFPQEGVGWIEGHVTVWIGVVLTPTTTPPSNPTTFYAPENPPGSAVTDVMTDNRAPNPVTKLVGAVTGADQVTWHWDGSMDVGTGVNNADYYSAGTWQYQVSTFTINSPGVPSSYPALGQEPHFATQTILDSKSSIQNDLPSLYTLVRPVPASTRYAGICVAAIDWLGNQPNYLTGVPTCADVQMTEVVTLTGGGSIELGIPGPTAFTLQGRAYDGAPSDHLVLQLCEPVTPGPCDYQATRTYAPGQYVISSVVGIPSGMVIPAGGGLELTGQLQLVSPGGQVLGTSGQVTMLWSAPIIGLSASPSTLPSGHTTTITASLLSPTPEDGWTVDFTSAEPGASATSCTIARGQASCSIRITRTVTATTTYTIGGHLASYPLASATTPVTWTVKGPGGGGGRAGCAQGGRVQSNPPDNTIAVWNLTNYYVSCSRVRLGVIRTWTVPRPPIRICVPGPRRRVEVLGPPLKPGGPPHASWHWVPGPPVCHWQARPPWVYVDTMIRLGVKWSWSANGSTPATSEMMYGPTAMGLPYPAELITNVWKYDSKDALVTVSAIQQLQEVQTRDGVVQWRHNSLASATPEVSQVEQVEGVPVGP